MNHRAQSLRQAAQRRVRLVRVRGGGNAASYASRSARFTSSANAHADRANAARSGSAASSASILRRTAPRIAPRRSSRYVARQSASAWAYSFLLERLAVWAGRGADEEPGFDAGASHRLRASSSSIIGRRHATDARNATYDAELKSSASEESAELESSPPPPETGGGSAPLVSPSPGFASSRRFAGSPRGGFANGGERSRSNRG